MTFALAAFALCSTAVVAGLYPARRAATVDLMDALRDE